MSTHHQGNREWEHWPGRRQPDDGIKGRLRSIFAPGDEQEAAIETAIAARGRELETQTAQLAETIADLERREQKTRELRAAVEEMLRRGSAELDERHAELNALALSLTKREDALSRSENDMANRRREAGAVELRRAALERRETAIVDREQALERISSELQERERQLREEQSHLRGRDAQLAVSVERAEEIGTKERDLAAREQTLAEREAALAAHEAELAERADKLGEISSMIEQSRQEIEELRAEQAAAEAAFEARVGDASALDRREHELRSLEASVEARERELQAARDVVAAGRGELDRVVTSVSKGLGLAEGGPAGSENDPAHVVFLPGERYRLETADGAVPAVGAIVERDGIRYRVVRVARSPLPGDRRRCAFVELAGA
jgi:chromosome segregation ATPase